MSNIKFIRTGDDSAGVKMKFGSELEKVLYDIRLMREWCSLVNKEAFRIWIDAGKPSIDMKFATMCRNRLNDFISKNNKACEEERDKRKNRRAT